MPTQGITLAWDSLSASIKEKQIIINSSGICKPGQMLAIMGPSGAGKTTLLSMMACKQDEKLTTSGQVI
jgi:ABC-type multidrug transport system ATPase subunit